MKRVHLILKQDVTSIPPIINLIDYLIEHKYEINLISSGEIIDRWKNYKSLNCFIVPQNRKNIVHKLLSWSKFRKYVKSYLLENYSDNDQVWVGSADAAIAIGPKILKKYNFSLQLHELYDDMPFYKKRLKNFCLMAEQVIVPEKNRALILRTWYQLTTTPFVIPNKPYIAKENELQLTNEVIDEIDQIKSNYKKLFLYQGMISKKRDIIPFIDVFDKGDFDENAALILIGPIYEEHLKKLIEKANNVFYLGLFKPPMHLEITKLCDVGILTYSYVNLNNLFCAPNKIWEYTAYGLPVISNFLPGINNFITSTNSGEIIHDLTNHIEIEEKIKSLYINYNDYEKGAKVLYKSIDLKKLYNSVIH
jgi:hypothetical protein